MKKMIEHFIYQIGYIYMSGICLVIILPFIGTVLGSACIFLFKDKIQGRMNKILTGFAAGVMVAASVWSLLIPSMEMSGKAGLLSVIPTAAGFMAGILFLLFLDKIVPHQHIASNESEGLKSHISKSAKMIFAVTLHNLPEGMAVGVTLAAALDHNSYIPIAGAFALSLGIAIQNFPEGAIVSMPLMKNGYSRWKSFIMGSLSGIIEPIGAVITILISSLVLPLLPYLLSFAAGAMIYVVVEELIPETQEGKHSNAGTIGFAIGFILMMSLDVVFG